MDHFAGSSWASSAPDGDALGAFLWLSVTLSTTTFAPCEWQRRCLVFLLSRVLYRNLHLPAIFSDVLPALKCNFFQENLTVFLKRSLLFPSCSVLSIYVIFPDSEQHRHFRLPSCFLQSPSPSNSTSVMIPGSIPFPVFPSKPVHLSCRAAWTSIYSHPRIRGS